MNNAVDIVFVLDKKYPDPNVTIRAKEKIRLVDNMIQTVENVSEKSFLSIPAYEGDEIKLLSQRDIVCLLLKQSDLSLPILRILKAGHEEVSSGGIICLSALSTLD